MIHDVISAVYNEIDIAPETLYTETTGNPLPDWMPLNC